MTQPERACERCQWWRYITTREARQGNRPVDIGACKRFPPVVAVDGSGKVSSRNPTTCGHDGCGEWKERHDG